MVRVSGKIGDPEVPPTQKALMNLTGSMLLALGIRNMSGLSDEELNEGDYNPNLRTRIGRTLFDITLGILFCAQREGGVGRKSVNMGYVGDPRAGQDKTAVLSRREQRLVDREFRQSPGDSCSMDTINRLERQGRIHPGSPKK